MYLCAKLEVDRMKTVGDSGIASLEGEERRESRERVERGRPGPWAGTPLERIPLPVDRSL